MTQLEELRSYIDKYKDEAVDLAKQIHGFAELSFEEVKSSGVLIEALKRSGFEIETGIADIPTAFTASFSYGSGKPVIGLLAEYDALDGLSQEAANPERCPVVQGGSGHGCGHNLLGTASYLSAVAIKDFLVNNKKDGTVIFFGCPAEEGAGSKQFIARAGYFDNVDYIYNWHPATTNEVPALADVAIMGATFEFDGIAAHAGGSPHLGRSALDACELMSVGVNYLREHMIDQARIHYAYKDAGGTAPNVVQDHAVVKYEVRAPKVSQMQELFTRVVDVAKGAALMTGTKMHYDISMAFSDYVPNKALAKVMDECMQECGAPEWSEEDYELAEKLLRTFNKMTLQNIREGLVEEGFAEEDEINELMRRPLDSKVHPYDPSKFKYESGSTDVGDVGYAAPTVCGSIATCCIGCVGHSWQWTSFSGSDIGMKGMIKAAEVMAYASVKTMDMPDVIEAAKKETVKRSGGKYVCPLPDYVKPPIGTY